LYFLHRLGEELFFPAMQVIKHLCLCRYTPVSVYAPLMDKMAWIDTNFDQSNAFIDRPRKKVLMQNRMYGHANIMTSSSYSSVDHQSNTNGLAMKSRPLAKSGPSV
jgi:hypothetical protein